MSELLHKEFKNLINNLPDKQTSNSSWHRTKIYPCSAVLYCNKCNEYRPITEFYIRRSKKSWRKDILNQSRQTHCKSCATKIYVQKDQELKMLYSARKHSKEKGVECTLNQSDIKIPSHCPVLGIELRPRLGLGVPNCRELTHSPSIDRIDNNKGYTPDNICVISTRANHLKSNGTIEEFEKIVSYFENIKDNKYKKLNITEESNSINIRKRLLRSAKNHSKQRNREFSLELSDINIPETCPILDIPLKSSWKTGCKSYRGFQSSPTVDRIDNDKGYIPDNIHIISARANHLKSDGTLDELKRILTYMKTNKTYVSREDKDTTGAA